MEKKGETVTSQPLARLLRENLGQLWVGSRGGLDPPAADESLNEEHILRYIHL